MVKVSDLLPLENVKSKILYAVNRKKKESDRASLAESGPTQIFESIQPCCVFEGTINIQAPAEDSGINLPVTEEKLKSAVNKFYIPLLESDIKTLKTLDISVLLINEINSKFKGQINKTVFLIRLGRHSGAEAVTIEGNRHIKIMQGRNEKPKYLDHATTFWLASEESKPKNNNGLLPFGWAVMEVVN
jgi:CRISPR-associated protein Csm5